MKFSHSLIVTLGCLGMFPLLADTPATIGLTNNSNPQGFISDSAPGAIMFSTVEGQRGNAVRLTEIRGTGLDKAIRLLDRADILAEARGEFANMNYLEAAKLFGEVADAYKYLIHIPNNFASEAKFYQIESLVRLGRYQVIQEMLDSPVGKTIDTSLGERYRDLSKYHKLWAIYGSGDLEKLAEEIKAYELPVVGKASLLPAPTLKNMPPVELIQIAFMRAKIYDKNGEKDNALQDYGRVFSYTYANNDFLSKQAMGSALVIMSQDPGLKSESEKVKKAAVNRMRSVAYFFSKRFPDTTMPPQFQEYAVRPEIEVTIAPSEGARTKVKKDDDEPAADPADADEPAEKSDGKSKG